MSDALLALRLFAVDPIGLGGIWVRGGSGAARDAWLARLAEQLPVRRLPVGIDDERLIGGVDLAGSLAAGRPVQHAGLLADAVGGTVLIHGAERARPMLVGRLAQAMDDGGPAAILLDDGGDDASVPLALSDRVAFHIDPAADELVSHSEGQTDPPISAQAAERVFETIAHVAEAFGVASNRALIFTLRAARAHAKLAGRDDVGDIDVAIAARLVLAPRATRLPVSQDPPPQSEDAPEDEGTGVEREQAPLEDLVVAAVKTALPAHVLDALGNGRSTARSPASRGAGARKRSPLCGRPLGTRPGMPRNGLRLALADTLRTAAPWQQLRGGKVGRVALRPDDFRIKRFEDRETALTIFAVDASGSAAFARMAEAKGAVELLLQRAYASRDEVALIAFRREAAELLLPPTRSLTRARRELADLPGGGGTPLAAGLDAARELAEKAGKRGRTPRIIVLTDGRANIATDGSQGRTQGTADALSAARRLAASGFPCVVIDVGLRGQAEALALAQSMKARMIHLPRADATALGAALAR